MNCFVDQREMDELKYHIRDLEMKQSMIIELEKEKEQMQKVLLDTSVFLDQVVKKHKSSNLVIRGNYKVLWNKHKNKIKELEQFKNSTECLKKKIDDLSKNYDNINNQLHVSYEKNKALEEENNKMNTSQKNQQELLESIKDDNEKLTERLNEVKEKVETLKKEKERYRKLKLNYESLQSKMMEKEEQSKLKELELTKNNDALKKKTCVQKCRIDELNECIRQKEINHEELKETLDKYNEKFKALKQKSEVFQTLANESSDILYKLECVAKQRDETQTKLDERTDELEKLCKQNEKLNTRVNELQRELDLASKDNDKKVKKLINNTTKKMFEEIKSETITILKEQLNEVRKTQKKEASNADNLITKFDELEQIEIQVLTENTPPKHDSCEDNDDSCRTDEPLPPVCFEEVSENLETENCQSTSVERPICCVEETEESQKHFEELIKNTISIVESFICPNQ